MLLQRTVCLLCVIRIQLNVPNFAGREGDEEQTSVILKIKILCTRHKLIITRLS